MTGMSYIFVMTLLGRKRTLDFDRHNRGERMSKTKSVLPIDPSTPEGQKWLQLNKLKTVRARKAKARKKRNHATHERGVQIRAIRERIKRSSGV